MNSATLLRKMDFDDVPVKPQRVYKQMNEFFDETPSSLRPSGSTRSGPGSFRRPASRATTSAAGSRDLPP
jgi:tartronate-semialdehyde synthase